MLAFRVIIIGNSTRSKRTTIVAARRGQLRRLKVVLRRRGKTRLKMQSQKSLATLIIITITINTKVMHWRRMS